MFEALFAAFMLVAVSEFGDRSQLAALLLGARYHKHHKSVFAGTVLAFAFLLIISISIGSLAISYFPESSVKIFSALAFIGMGLFILLKKEKEVKIKKDKEPFFAAFSLIALSEIGDKTQIAIIFLAASFQDAAGTFFGAITAMAFLSGTAIFAGKLIAKRIKMRWIKYVSGIIFILFGLLSFLR